MRPLGSVHKNYQEKQEKYKETKWRKWNPVLAAHQIQLRRRRRRKKKLLAESPDSVFVVAFFVQIYGEKKELDNVISLPLQGQVLYCR